MKINKLKLTAIIGGVSRVMCQLALAPQVLSILSKLEQDPKISSLVNEYNTASGTKATDLYGQVLQQANSVYSGAASLIAGAPVYTFGNNPTGSTVSAALAGNQNEQSSEEGPTPTLETFSVQATQVNAPVGQQTNQSVQGEENNNGPVTQEILSSQQSQQVPKSPANNLPDQPPSQVSQQTSTQLIQQSVDQTNQALPSQVSLQISTQPIQQPVTQTNQAPPYRTIQVIQSNQIQPAYQPTQTGETNSTDNPEIQTIHIDQSDGPNQQYQTIEMGTTTGIQISPTIGLGSEISQDQQLQTIYLSTGDNNQESIRSSNKEIQNQDPTSSTKPIVAPTPSNGQITNNLSHNISSRTPVNSLASLTQISQISYSLTPEVVSIINRLEDDPQLVSMISEYNVATGDEAKSIYTQVLTRANNIVSGAASLIQQAAVYTVGISGNGTNLINTSGTSSRNSTISKTTAFVSSEKSGSTSSPPATVTQNAETATRSNTYNQTGEDVTANSTNTLNSSETAASSATSGLPFTILAITWITVGVTFALLV